MSQALPSVEDTWGTKTFGGFGGWNEILHPLWGVNAQNRGTGTSGMPVPQQGPAGGDPFPKQPLPGELPPGVPTTAPPGMNSPGAYGGLAPFPGTLPPGIPTTAPSGMNSPGAYGGEGFSSALDAWMKANGINIDDLKNGGSQSNGLLDWLKKFVSNPAALIGGGLGIAEIISALKGNQNQQPATEPAMRALLDMQGQQMARVDPIKQSIELLASKAMPIYAREGIPPYQPKPLTYDPSLFTTPQK